MGAKSDWLSPKVSEEGQLPGLPDEEFKEAMDEKEGQIRQMGKKLE